MTDHQQDFKPTFDLDQLWGIDTRPDPVWEEQKATARWSPSKVMEPCR